MNTLIYVDAENVSFPDFKRYFDTNFKGVSVTGKVYGNNEILGEAVIDYLRIGFEYVNTALLSSSSKNVADMKILTDCAFDVFQLTSTGNTTVTLVTKDCDFLPLVYRLTSIGVPVSVPMIGKDKLMTVPRSAVTKALEEKNYNPMSSDAWLLPQLPIVENLLRNDFNYSTIAHFCNRKRSRFIRAVANNNSLLAMKLDEISEESFSMNAVYEILIKEHCSKDEIVEYVAMYTNKYFGKAFKPKELPVKIAAIGNVG